MSRKAAGSGGRHPRTALGDCRTPDWGCLVTLAVAAEAEKKAAEKRDKAEAGARRKLEHWKAAESKTEAGKGAEDRWEPFKRALFSNMRADAKILFLYYTSGFDHP